MIISVKIPNESNIKAPNNWEYKHYEHCNCCHVHVEWFPVPQRFGIAHKLWNWITPWDYFRMWLINCLCLSIVVVINCEYVWNFVMWCSLIFYNFVLMVLTSHDAAPTYPMSHFIIHNLNYFMIIPGSTVSLNITGLFLIIS